MDSCPAVFIDCLLPYPIADTILARVILTRQEQEEFEASRLAPYGQRSADSRGRSYEEPAHDLRPEFQRDRDRIIHSRAFRRLEYKTQVFINGTADHYRTRLTHTMEMAAMSRTLARTLRVNEDLAEAIALAHDLGHSPFGHCGEEVLDEMMRDEGGFDHNRQSCRCVEFLEYQYPNFQGLNLTWEVRAGLRKHLAAEPGAELDGFPLGPFQSMEAQIADIADDIIYQVHDVDDGLEAGLITIDDLRHFDVWRIAEQNAGEQYGAIPQDRLLRVTLRNLLDMQARDVLATTTRRLQQYRPDSPLAVMQAPQRMVALSADMEELMQPLRKFLVNNVYWAPGVTKANREAVRMMRGLLLHYVHHPETMGRKARARLESVGLWRTACDYVAGCTDRYAIEEYQRFGLGPGQ